MSRALRRCLAALERVDRELVAAVGVPRSLAPARPSARGLAELAPLVLAEGDEPALIDAFADGAAAIARAQLREFPDNLLWDRDAMLAALLARARRSATPAEQLAGACAVVVALHATFGASTSIRFRYVHDFVYGFDWAKWVKRDPARRANVGPYDPEFLAAMRVRGDQLLHTIASGDDTKYPRLVGSGARNPFGFSREPDDELALHEHLAHAGYIPVDAWRIDPQPRWREDFDEIRRREAANLGLSRDRAAG